jgi:hypothetical protein
MEFQICNDSITNNYTSLAIKQNGKNQYIKILQQEMYGITMNKMVQSGTVRHPEKKKQLARNQK